MHYVYITTDLTNNIKYIGQRKCPKNKTPENDTYLGSGTRLLNAIKKRGRKHFKKEIISEYDNQYDADNKEIELIRKYNAVENDMFYNLAYGGQFWRENQPEYMSDKMKKFYSDPDNIEKLKKASNKKYGKIYGVKPHLVDAYRESLVFFKNINSEILRIQKKTLRENKRKLKKEWKSKPIAIFIKSYNAKMNNKGGAAFKEKMKDPVFSENHKRKISEGMKHVDHKKQNLDKRARYSKEMTKNITPFHEILFEHNLGVTSLTKKSANMVRALQRGRVRTIPTFYKNVFHVIDELKEYNLDEYLDTYVLGWYIQKFGEEIFKDMNKEEVG